MDAELLRAAMRIGVLIALLAGITLPFQDPSSAAFVVDAMAFVVGIVFVVGVALLARRANATLPRDNRPASRYNTRDRPRGREK